MKENTLCARNVTFRILTKDVGMTQRVTIQLWTDLTFGDEENATNVISFLPGTKYAESALQIGNEVLARALAPLLRSAFISNPHLKEVSHDYEVDPGTGEDLDRLGDWLSQLPHADEV